MLALANNLSIYVYTQPTDLRKGFEGLSGIVRSELRADPLDGSSFLFFNRRRDRLKMLYLDGTGYWIHPTYRLVYPESNSYSGDSKIYRISELPMTIPAIYSFWAEPTLGRGLSDSFKLMKFGPERF